jgi:alkylated DNA nucleotide flippase Atl1
MSAVPDDSDIPWHRVINARGEVSHRSAGSAFERIQRALLEAEGIAFDAPGGSRALPVGSPDPRQFCGRGRRY